MTSWLMRRVALRRRIHCSYFAAAAVTAAVVLLSCATLIRLAADFRRIVQFSSRAADNMVLAAEMAEMQRLALIYIYEGHRAAGEQVGRICRQMQEEMRQSGRLDHAQADALVALADKHLDAYYEAFQEVQRQRELQQQLVRSGFRIHASRAQQLIEALIAASKDMALTLQGSQMLNSLLQIEKNAYRYFDSLDAGFVQAATASIKATEATAASLPPQSEAMRLQLHEIAAVLERYEATLLEAVQRTRGYLYLVNVVMAAEAYETLHQTKSLSNLMLAESEQLRRQVLARIRSRLNLLLAAAGLLLLGMALSSYAISRSITIPLKRLTATFKLLSSGSAEAEIPAYPLEDELGDLTKAAAAFKAKNIELRASKKELERSNEELEQFVYTVSHDLKSPIVTSMGFIGIIRKLASQGKAEQAIGMLAKVVKANERMSQLINDLLELSRVGRVDMDKKLLDLNLLLAEFSRIQTERLAAAGFTLRIEPGLPTIHANESRSLQVFENILSNALKYANKNRNGRLRISGFTDGQWHHLLCADNGPGIPEEYREKIFGLFYRLDVNMEGTGIGLAVAKKIMKFHGGEIRAEAGPDGGAVFHLLFPKAADTAAVQTEAL